MRRIDTFLDFLRAQPNWEEILTSAPYSLKIQKEGDFVLFKYDQINSDFSNDFVQLCRGLILFHPDKYSWAVACHPFDKFFNYGESNAVEIDWKTAVISTKEDGSLMKVWWWAESGIFLPMGLLMLLKLRQTICTLLVRFLKSHFIAMALTI